MGDAMSINTVEAPAAERTWTADDLRTLDPQLKDVIRGSPLAGGIRISIHLVSPGTLVAIDAHGLRKIANWIGEELFEAHRGILRISDTHVIAFGNDG